MTKEYITWTKKYEAPRCFSHPEDGIKALWNGVVEFKHVLSGNEKVDMRNLATIEYASDFDKVDRFLNNFGSYSLVSITKEKALALAIEWHGEYFQFDTDGFTIIDNRPQPE